MLDRPLTYNETSLLIIIFMQFLHGLPHYHIFTQAVFCKMLKLLLEQHFLLAILPSLDLHCNI